MKAKQVRKEVIYEITLDQDELDLLTAILGRQIETKEIKHMFAVLTSTGGDYASWCLRRDSHGHDAWTKVEK